MATSPLELFVADQMPLVEPHAMRRTQSGKADRVRSDVVMLLKVQGVADQPQHFEPPIVQTEQRADAHVVATGLHSARNAVEPP